MVRLLLRGVAIAFVVTACSSSASGTESAGTVDEGGPNVFTLTSAAFADMGMIGAMYHCRGVSPPLSWTPGPAGTQSYAVLMTDVSSRYHWAIWDIPLATTSLPEGVAQEAMPAVPAGTQQNSPGIDGATLPGYTGPCSYPTMPYTFTVYALSVATLPGVTPASTGAAVFAAIQANTLASAQLIGLAYQYRS